MAFQAVFGELDAQVHFGGIGVDVMAIEAGQMGFAIDDYLLDIPIDVPVAGVQFGDDFGRKIDGEILEKIVAGDELIWVWEAAGFGFGPTEVTLAAD